MHRDFLRRLFGVRKFTANNMVLAELGRFPLQIHLRQRILWHRTVALDNVHLVRLAMVDGCVLDQTAIKDSWQHYLGSFLHGHVGQQQLIQGFDIASIIERARHEHAFTYFADEQHSSLMLYRTMQPKYKPAEYLSSVHQLEG
ncbi:TPA: hypothetical protein ACH3X2_000081 [Trebouxia sp. C0005]